MSSHPYDAQAPGPTGRGTGAPGRLLPARLAAVAAVLALVGILSAFFVVGGLLGLVLGALTLVFVVTGVAALLLGFRGLGGTARGAIGGRRMALAAIVGGAAALLLALLLVLLVALPVGAFFTRYSDELSDLDQCLQGAGADQSRIIACQDDFARKVEP